MKRKRWLAMLAAGAMCVAMVAGCGSSTSSSSSSTGSASDDTAAASSTSFDGSVTLLMSNKDEFLGTLDEAAKASAASLDVDLTSVDCGDDMDKQIDAVSAAVANGTDALIVVLADDTRAEDVIEAAEDVPVVFVNRIPQDSSVLDETHIYVGSDENESGVYQGELLVEALEADGKDSITYLLLGGTTGLLHTTARTEGVLSVLEEAGITATAVTDVIDCDFLRSTAMDAVLTLAANGQDLSEIDCIIANNDAMALGALEAYNLSDVDASDLYVVGVDGTSSGLQAISDGDMTATVYQNASGQGSASVRAAINLASGVDYTTGISYEKDSESDIIWIPFEKVNADNVSDYY